MSLTSITLKHGDKVAVVNPARFKAGIIENQEGRIIDHIDRKDVSLRYKEFFQSQQISEFPMILVEFYDTYFTEYFLQIIPKGLEAQYIKKLPL